MRRYPLVLSMLMIISVSTHANAQVISSKFEPLSYEEMTAPLIIYRNFVRECSAKLLDLLNRSQEVEPYIDQSKDPQTWRRYNDYYGSVCNEAKILLEYGTNQGTRGRIFKLQQEFSVIKGIADAYKRRKELYDDQYRYMRSTNKKPDRLYIEISLDEFLDGQTPIIYYH